MLLVAGVQQLLASLALGFVLGVLGCGDLRLRLARQAPERGASESRHRRVDHLRALLGHLCQQGVVSDPDRLRDLGEHGLGFVGVVVIEQRTDRETGRSSDEDSERPAEDADEKADEAPRRGSDEVPFPANVLSLPSPRYSLRLASLLAA